jgi:hypothetical protein
MKVTRKIFRDIEISTCGIGKLQPIEVGENIGKGNKPIMGLDKSGFPRVGLGINFLGAIVNYQFLKHKTTTTWNRE